MPASQRGVIYLDNAATSWPKPDCVNAAARDHLLRFSANPGRAAHQMAANASRIVYDTRERLASLLGARDSRQIIMTANATAGLNLAIHGLLKPGDHVVTTSIEHNSVMRPLRHQAEYHDVSVTRVSTDSRGRLNPENVRAAVTRETKMVVINHASNVVGTIAPVEQIKEMIGDVALLVDAAQTAGVVPIDVEATGIDMLACTGHKGLLGPQGTGCLYIAKHMSDKLRPLLQGGSGSNSESDAVPEGLPDRFEAGTVNGTGIAALGAAVGYILDRGVEEIRRHELELAARLYAGMKDIPGLTEYGPQDIAERTGTFSIKIEGIEANELGFILDREYNIAVRVGLHCSPEAHRTIGTFPKGTVRIGLGAMTTEEEIDSAVSALSQIAARNK